MISVILEFYSKKTEFLEKKFEIQLPEKMVFDVSKTQDKELIKCLGWDISEDMVNYINTYYSEISEDLKNFHVQFTGANN